MATNYYRYSLARSIEIGPLRLALFQTGPDHHPVAQYVAIEWHHGAGFPDGKTGLLRLKRRRPDTVNYWAPFIVWFKRTWKEIQRKIWSGTHDRE